MYSCFPQILYSFSLPCGATVMNIYKGIIYIYILYIYIYIIYIYIYIKRESIQVIEVFNKI